MTDDTRDRVIRLEAEVDGMEKTLEDVRSKVNETCLCKPVAPGGWCSVLLA